MLSAKTKQFEGLVRVARDVWFDAVCLNKHASSEEVSKEVRTDSKEALSFATLPISVGNCKKLLVSLSPSYLSRLWCVWELQTVFAFSIHEVSISRINILSVDMPAFEIAVKNWSLNDAHCFDPNEEFKMRHIAYAIGEERFVDAVRSLLLCHVLPSEESVTSWLFRTVRAFFKKPIAVDENNKKTKGGNGLTQELLPVRDFSLSS